MTNDTSPMTQPTTDHALDTAPAPASLSTGQESVQLAASSVSNVIQEKTDDTVSAKKDYAFITGASSGIGEAFARLFASKKKPLVLVGQKEEKLKALATELREKEGIDVRFLAINLARSKDMPQLPDKLRRMDIAVDVLVNCAGFGKHGRETDIRFEDALNMINLNCRALLSLTKIFLPEMLKHNKGAIINIASVAGFFPVPYLATYAATKAFVVSYTEALAEELAATGVRALCVCPTPTATNFYKTAGINPSQHAHLKDLNDPQTVAEAAIEALKAGKRIAVVGKAGPLLRYAPTLIPRSILRSYGAKLMGPK